MNSPRRRFEKQINLIAEKYAAVDESESDVVDLTNLVLVKDRGHLRNKQKAKNTIWFTVFKPNLSSHDSDEYITEEETVVSDDSDIEINKIPSRRGNRERVELEDVVIELIDKDIKESKKERRAARSCRPPMKRPRVEKGTGPQAKHIPDDPLDVVHTRLPARSGSSRQPHGVRTKSKYSSLHRRRLSPDPKTQSLTFQFESIPTSCPSDHQGPLKVEDSRRSRNSEDENCFLRFGNYTDTSSNDDSSTSLSDRGSALQLSDSNDLELSGEAYHVHASSPDFSQGDTSAETESSFSDSADSSSPAACESQSLQRPLIWQHLSHSTRRSGLKSAHEYRGSPSLRQHVGNGYSPQKTSTPRGKTTLINRDEHLKQLAGSPRTKLANSLSQININSPKRSRSGERMARRDSTLVRSGSDKYLELCYRRVDNSSDRAAAEYRMLPESPRTRLAYSLENFTINSPTRPRSTEKFTSPRHARGREDESSRSRGSQRRMLSAAFQDLHSTERRMSQTGRPRSLQRVLDRHH